MEVFDPINTPLEGTNLIEASAGTGKTYTIAGLFLRLILEKQFTVNEILVVTFTKAATEELKDRIRNKLLSAKSAFLKGEISDSFIEALVKKTDNPDLAIQWIQDALINFDNAAIFTIHGFCQRILRENAFETQNLFDTELVTDQAPFTREIVEDFWRKHIYSLPMELMSYVLKKVSGPEYFLRLLAQKRTTDIKVVPELKKPDLKSLGNFRATFNALKNAWPDYRSQVMELLKDPSLSGIVYGGLKTKQAEVSKRELMIGSMSLAMDRFVDDKSIGFPLFKGFEKFTATKIKTSTRKYHIPPVHEIFDICAELYDNAISLEAEMEMYLLYLKGLFFKFTEARLEDSKYRGNIQFYDDLLIKVKDALENKGGTKLASTLRKKYRSALVDEFQDTDTVQYAIFSRIFTSKKSSLFMIGDPKQSIYSFRGADIFSYMNAARNADSKYTLTKNWRSEPNLITAVNTMFSSTPVPFLFNQIGFEKGLSGKKSDSEMEKHSPGLILWVLGSKKNGNESKPLSKAEIVPLIARAVADEISHLISKDKNNFSNNINAGEIAVLVRTNRQAQIIKNALSLRNIPSVLHNTGNIFHTHEAVEMERILSSIADPGNQRIFHAALVNDTIGVSGKELDSANAKPYHLEDKLNRFKKYSQLWNTSGFIRMFRKLMAEEKVRERLLGFPDGERRLTNILHLAEILHQESFEKKLGMIGLLKWLSEQRNADIPESETHQLRLESDNMAVNIITIHKSKGLEFPIVFCPFVWDGAIIKDQEILFHDTNNHNLPTLDLGSKEFAIHLANAQSERLAENLRLLYVALTRAIKRCYLVWGRVNSAETAAIAYLLHYQPPSLDDFETERSVISIKSSILEKSDADFLKDLKQISEKSGGNIKIVPLPLHDDAKYFAEADEKKRLSCRQFSGQIDTSWKISSYSYLISQRTLDAELPDHDEYHDIFAPDSESDPSPYEEENIFSFPRGTRAGIFFHDLFEHLDFETSNREKNHRLVTQKLKDHRFESKWQKAVCAMIDNVLTVPLEMNNIKFMFSSIQCKSRINEMEFYFPVKPVSSNRLGKIFSDYGGINLPDDFPERLGKLGFSLNKGFLKGYIDLVFWAKNRFWLADWKSNFLGTTSNDYGKDALNSVMSKNFYILQYHLYTLALHQYLRLRIPDFSYKKHFGGVFYIFLRGVDSGKGSEYGVYKDFPNPDLIQALVNEFIPGIGL